MDAATLKFKVLGSTQNETNQQMAPSKILEII